jgi:hypothetical protein
VHRPEGVIVARLGGGEQFSAERSLKDKAPLSDFDAASDCGNADAVLQVLAFRP